MKNSKAMVFTTAAVMLASCGTEKGQTDQKPTEVAKPAFGGDKAPAKDDTAALQFKGFVGGAFPITVDGISYEDSEDFYTKELQNLPEKTRDRKVPRGPSLPHHRAYGSVHGGSTRLNVLL